MHCAGCRLRHCGRSRVIAALMHSCSCRGMPVAESVAVAAQIEAKSDSSPAVAGGETDTWQRSQPSIHIGCSTSRSKSSSGAGYRHFPSRRACAAGLARAELARLNRLIDRAENAPFPPRTGSAAHQKLPQIPTVRVLLDSLAGIERDRNAFGAVGTVDPVYLALTSRANAIGRSRQAVADAKRGESEGNWR